MSGEAPYPGAILDAIQDGIIVLDRDLTVLGINKTIRRRYPDLDLVGNRCYRAYHGRSEPCENCPGLRALRSGKPEVEEFSFTRADGTAGYLESHMFPMAEDSGEVSTVVGHVRDISDRKRSEAVHREREELYRSLFENNIAVMLLIDPETGEIHDANARACAYYGWAKDHLTRMKITDINMMSADDVHAEMRKARSEQRTHFNFLHRLADGSAREVEVFSGPLVVEGRELLCSVIHDISERTTIERERELLIGELQQAMSEVKTLRGFIPICSSCKKVRDDQGYWNQIECYLRDRSEAEFSHGLCPECIKKYYPPSDRK